MGLKLMKNLMMLIMRLSLKSQSKQVEQTTPPKLLHLRNSNSTSRSNINNEIRIIPEDAYIIDVTNEHMMDGPEGNPALAAKMLKQFEDVGLVLMRGQPKLADRLDVMREW